MTVSLLSYLINHILYMITILVVIQELTRSSPDLDGATFWHHGAYERVRSGFKCLQVASSCKIFLKKEEKSVLTFLNLVKYIFYHLC